jgi:hypothetical protein
LCLLAGWLAPRDAPRASWRSLVAGALAAWAVVLTLCLPFGVGVPPFSGQTSLRSRLAWSWNSNGKLTSYNAFNLWRTPFLRGHTLDNEVGWFGWSLQSWGKLLAATVYLLIVMLYARERSRRGLVWAVLATMLTLALLPTRSHERYLFPALTLALLLAALRGSAVERWVAALLSLTLFINLYWTYGLTYHAPQTHWMYSTHAVGYCVSLLNLALLVAVMATGPWRVARIQFGRAHAEAAASTATTIPT